MSIFINKNTRIITQGITGKTGQFHTEKCQEYANGKNCFVAGVNPKKAGESIFNIPIFGSLRYILQLFKVYLIWFSYILLISSYMKI